MTRMDGRAEASRAERTIASIEQRFVVGDELGKGACGTVLRAYDQRRRHDVALKYLRSVHPDALYQFKQEFRLLTALVHPHVLTLYELIGSGDHWVVVMQLIERARSFLDFVRPHAHLVEKTPHSKDAVSASIRSREATVTSGTDWPKASANSRSESSVHVVEKTQTVTVASSRPATAAATPPRRRALREARLHPDRLVSGLLQLVEGLEAVHRLGLLHRDIKPSNILVDGSGRVVVCDFGLAAVTRERRAQGTPAYMSPEQGRGTEQSSATDLYSVGVMIYEALTGQLPVTASTFDAFVAGKIAASFASPRELDSEADEALSDLCMALLSPEPGRRPGIDEIRKLLMKTSGSSRSSVDVVHAPTDACFVGRERECTMLSAALRDTRDRSSIAIVVSGPSGVGKSALVGAVCNTLRDQQGALIFVGRCYETESVPFKALDAVIDGIAAHLRMIAHDEARRLIPEEIDALAELFPVLRLAPAVSESLAHAAGPLAPNRIRPRAQRGFRKLIEALARARPVLIVIDDLQWGDLDSEPFLRELVDEGQPPGALIIATERVDTDDAAERSSLLAEWAKNPLGQPRDFRRWWLEPLDASTAAQLVRAIAKDDIDADTLASLVDQGAGNPMFIAELAHAAGSGRARFGGLGLDALLAARIEALPRASRELLEATALVATPQPLRLLSRAMHIEDEAAALAQLRAARLVRTVAGRDGERIVTYHDRIRETAVGRLSDELRHEMHRRLARVFEAEAEPDYEALATHWVGAGRRQRGFEYTLLAAEAALRARAYQRAAAHYGRALAMNVAEGEASRQLERAHADSLRLAGISREAATQYAKLAQTAPKGEADECRAQALTCLLRAGAIEEAKEMARTHGHAAGERIPASPMELLVPIVAGWWALKAYRRRSKRLLPADSLFSADGHRLTVQRDIASALANIEPVPAFALHRRYLRHSLRSGDPRHVCYALAQEAALLCALGGARAQRRCTALLAEAHRTAGSAEDDSYVAFAEGMEGLGTYLSGAVLRDSARKLLESRKRLEDDPSLSWVVDFFSVYGTNALALAGSFGALSTDLRLALNQARAAGNRFLWGNLCRQVAVQLFLAQDRPGDIRALLVETDPGLRKELDILSWYHLCHLAEVDAYTGNASGAVDALALLWRRMRGTSPGRTAMCVLYTAWVWGRAVVLATEGDARTMRAQLRPILRIVRRIRGKLPWFSRAVEATLAGGLAAAAGNLDEAAAWWRSGVEQAEAMQSELLAKPMEYRLGQLLGGDRGSELLGRVRAWARAEDVRSLDRFVALRCPG